MCELPLVVFGFQPMRRRAGIRGLLYYSATCSQKANRFRGLSCFLSAVSNDAQSQGGHFYFCILLRLTVGHNSGQSRNLGKPASSYSIRKDCDSPSGGCSTVAM